MKGLGVLFRQNSLEPSAIFAKLPARSFNQRKSNVALRTSSPRKSRVFFARTIFKMSEVQEETKRPFKRLPTSVVPSNYQITLQPNLQDFKFKGSQIVDLEVINLYKSVQAKQRCVIQQSSHHCTDLRPQSAEYGSYRTRSCVCRPIGPWCVRVLGPVCRVWHVHTRDLFVQNLMHTGYIWVWQLRWAWLDVAP